MGQLEPITEIDATGLSCPMPVIELSSAIDQIEIGQVVRLVASDPTARVDVPVWCRMRRHRVRSIEEGDEGRLVFAVERRR